MQVATDACCLRVLTSEKLLVAVGNQLSLWYTDGEGVTQRRMVAGLPRLKDKIHGIDFCDAGDKGGGWLIVFHAGREAYSVVLSQDNTFSGLAPIPTYNRETNLLFYPQDRNLLAHSFRRSNDWISTLRLLDSEHACAITGHGVAILYHRNHAGQWMAVDQCCCEDSSTLYCSQIVVGNDAKWEELICFSGTALGLLVVWRIGRKEEEGQKLMRGQILCSIGAHNGVVFSIECDLERGFLTTTSDDRSVKFWELKMGQDGGSGVELVEKNYCFGHTARVFQCRIIRGSPDKNCCWVVSIGEDSNLCLWDEGGNLLVKKRLVEGATLWNLDYDEATGTVYVCASNGDVAKFNIRKYLTSDRTGFQEELLDVTPSLEKEHLTKVKFLPDGSLVVVTNNNRILLLRQDLVDVVIDKLEHFKCSILDVSGDRIFVAGDKWLNVYCWNSESGHISLLKSMELDFNRDAFEPEADPIKFSIIRSLHVCDSGSKLVLCDNNGRCLIYSVDDAETLLSCHRIPKSSERWLTFAFKVDHFFLLADRSGHLYLFNESQTNPIFKLSHLHGKLGVTHITLDEKTHQGFFLTTAGHDGHLRSILLDATTGRLETYEARKTAISWIDRIHEPRQLIMGFNDCHFVVAAATTSSNDQLFSIDCGGGHRYWDVVLIGANTLKFVFIQHKRLKSMTIKLEDEKEWSCRLELMPRLGWHTKACNVARIVRSSEGKLWFVSGGEDNVLRINGFSVDADNDGGGGLEHQPKKHLQCHISSIKSICLSEKRPDGKILILSAGGRAQLCFTTLDLNNLHRTKDELSYMLLSSDSDRSRWRTNRTASFDPETRFMCALLFESDSSLFIGCSDGFLRKFKVSLGDASYEVNLVEEAYYARCFLHIGSFTFENRTVIVTMATDGFICFWDPITVKEPFFKLKHHDSGINAFDLKQMDNSGRFMVATGGDDQTVAVTKFLFRVDKHGKMLIDQQGTLVLQGVHIGQVTGVRFGENDTIWSAGVDQVVCHWSFSGFKNITVLKRLSTCVADVKGLELVPEIGGIYVYGWGYEFISNVV